MEKNMLKLIGAACLCLAPVVATAKPVTWECVYSKDSTGWVGKDARFIIDEAAGTATVLDGAVQSVYKKPIAVKYRSKAGGEHVLSWKVRGVPGHKRRTVEGTVRMDTDAKLNPKYWATLDPEARTVSVRVRVGTATSTYWGKGRCKVAS
jgi:hypothetical protein